MAASRPGGVVLIAVLAWIGAIGQIASGILLLTGTVAIDGVDPAVGWVAVAVGVIGFLIAFLLFSGSNFARVLVTLSFLLSLGSAVYALVTQPGNAVAPLISGFVAVIGLILLYTRAANEFFRS